MHLDTNDVLTTGVGQRIFAAVLALDEATLRDEFRSALSYHGIDALVADVMLPVLRTVGTMWQAGELSVMHEHHASHIVRSVIAEFRGPAVARHGRRVVLACPPGELHDLPTHLFAAMLLQRGWAPVVLGANVPWAATSAAMHSAEADACVIVARKAAPFIARRRGLEIMARTTPVFLAGPGAKSCRITGVVELPDDWRTAADMVNASARRHARSSAAQTPNAPRPNLGELSAHPRSLAPVATPS